MTIGYPWLVLLLDEHAFIERMSEPLDAGELADATAVLQAWRSIASTQGTLLALVEHVARERTTSETALLRIKAFYCAHQLYLAILAEEMDGAVTRAVLRVREWYAVDHVLRRADDETRTHYSPRFDFHRGAAPRHVQP